MHEGGAEENGNLTKSTEKPKIKISAGDGTERLDHYDSPIKK